MKLVSCRSRPHHHPYTIWLKLDRIQWWSIYYFSQRPDLALHPTDNGIEQNCEPVRSVRPWVLDKTPSQGNERIHQGQHGVIDDVSSQEAKMSQNDCASLNHANNAVPDQKQSVREKQGETVLFLRVQNIVSTTIRKAYLTKMAFLKSE